MAKKRAMYTTEQLLQLGRAYRREATMTAVHQADMLAALAILWDCFDFDAEDLKKFIDLQQEFLESYENGVDDVWIVNQNLYEATGIRVLPQNGEESTIKW